MGNRMGVLGLSFHTLCSIYQGMRQDREHPAGQAPCNRACERLWLRQLDHDGVALDDFRAPREKQFSQHHPLQMSVFRVPHSWWW